MQKPLTEPSIAPLLRYVRTLVAQAIQAEGYTPLDVRIDCSSLSFYGYWTGLVSVHGQVSHGGVYYDLDGWGEVDKVVGEPVWRSARIDIRLHSDPCEPTGYQLDVAHLKVRDRNTSR